LGIAGFHNFVCVAYAKELIPASQDKNGTCEANVLGSIFLCVNVKRIFKEQLLAVEGFNREEIEQYDESNMLMKNFII